ncbi:MAG TPA: hypothetical protein VKD90_04165, partial [Gemmataceae bacterium]|nr:hypothetical protein [Gemmataceae bacterium]
YIAGGTLCGLLILTLFNFWEDLGKALNFGFHLFSTVNEKTGKLEWTPDEVGWTRVAAVVMFGLLAAYLFWVGSRKRVEDVTERPRQE